MSGRGGEGGGGGISDIATPLLSSSSPNRSSLPHRRNNNNSPIIDDGSAYYNPQSGDDNFGDNSSNNNKTNHSTLDDENNDDDIITITKTSRPSCCCCCLPFQTIYLPLITRILTALFALSLIGLVLGLLPYFAVIAGKKGHLNQTLYWIAGVFVLITIPISVWGIVLHLVNWYMPRVQKFVVRILFMVPIFAIQSWFSLFFRSASPYLTAVRDLYEAFVLASFVYYIIELCGGEDQLVDKLRMKDPSYGEHRIFSCQKQQQRRHWQMGRPFLLNCKYGVLQFVFFKIITTIIVIVLHSLDDFHKGSKRWNSSFIALAVIMNLSITYALYCLVKLYFATKDFLKEWNPVWKFLCIKGIIFFTFWQGFVIQVLYSVGLIEGFGDWDAAMVADGLPDFLICIEMLGFAVLHTYAFPHTDYLHYLQRHQQSKSGGGGVGGGSAGWSSSPARIRNETNAEPLLLFDQDNNVVNDTSIDTEYQPPTVHQLDQPLSISRAILGTVNPSETLSDIARMGGSVVVGGDGSSAGRGGSSESRRGDVIFSLDQAEGI